MGAVVVQARQQVAEWADQLQAGLEPGDVDLGVGDDGVLCVERFSDHNLFLAHAEMLDQAFGNIPANLEPVIAHRHQIVEVLPFPELVVAFGLAICDLLAGESEHFESEIDEALFKSMLRLEKNMSAENVFFFWVRWSSTMIRK